METKQWLRLSRAFDELCDLDPQTRKARLEEIERRAPDLVLELRAMLAADSTGRGALAGGPLALGAEGAGAVEPDGAMTERDPTDAGVPDRPTRIGPWLLRERLGAGGMGEVWAAERAEGGFAQRVAIKLLKRGMDSEEITRRFLRERRILARLEHPGIARLFDGSTAPDGRPYFVLERVDGSPLTTHCRERGLGLAERLRLVIAACDAVAFAHGQLVVHRDLKPSNIMVTAAGEVKLLDFGIAKLLEAEEDATATQADARVLTPSYAAPEQILGEPPTTATDVYGLGVVLYELLTGRLPHRRRGRGAVALASEAAAESVEPPSRAVLREPTEVTIPGGALRLSRALGGDLDTVALKALDREPERRYPSAAALGEDLRRFLAGRPIAARPDTVAYRVGKFVRRHRAAVVAAGLALASLVGGLATALWQADRARAAQAHAESEARRAVRVKAFVVRLFQASNPELVRSVDVSAGELLAEGVQRLEVELDAEPRVQAEILDAVARAELSLGQVESAARHAERAKALLASDPDSGSSVAVRAGVATTLAAVEAARGDLPAAERLLRATLAEAASSGGATPLDLAAIGLELGRTLGAEAKHEDAIEVLRDAYALDVAAGEVGALPALDALRELALNLSILRRHDEAEALFREALAASETLLRDRPLVRARLDRAYAIFLFSRRQFEPSLEVARRTLDTHLRLLGADHVETAESQRVVATSLFVLGRQAEAVGLLEQAAATFAAVAPGHPLREETLEELAMFEFHAGKTDLAVGRMAAMVADLEQRFGPDANQTMRAQVGLTAILEGAGRDEEAARIYARLLPVARARPGAFDADRFAQIYSSCGNRWLRQGRADDAIELLREGARGARERFGPRSNPTERLDGDLARALGARGRKADRVEARALLEPLARKAIGEFQHGGPHPLELLAEIEMADGNFEEASRHLELLLARFVAEGAPGSGGAMRARRSLARVLVRLGRFEEARELLEEVVAVRRARYGESDPRTREVAAELAGIGPR